jgi:sigma-B regulation protein RsbU (phosphoserine phosphatase)
MRPVDLANNPRIPVLLEMVREVSQATTPAQVLTAFSSRYWSIRRIDYYLSVSVRNLEPGQYKITRRLRVDDARAGRTSFIGADPWRDWEQIPLHSGGFVGAMITTPEPKLMRHLDLRGDPVLGDELADMHCCMVNPLFDQGRALNWAFSFLADPEGYTTDELEQALLIGNLIGGTNRRLVLVDEVRRLNATLTAQFEEVARLQRALLPQKIPEIPGLEIATSYLTSDQAGGDYYDFFQIPGGRWGILIADVSGHGAAAATVMAMLHAIVHGYAGSDYGPEAVLHYANKRLVEAGFEGSFVTAFAAVYDPANATFRYSRSGHNPPRLKDGRTGAITVLDGAATLPLGVVERYEVSSETLRLKRDDTVVLYTDGITEAFGGGREMFGVERLDAALAKCTGQPDCVIESVHAALYAHTKVRTRADDQTLVAIRYTGNAGKER